MKYEFRYIIRMTNGKKYEIITNFHEEKDVLKYIDSHDYIELFDRKIEEMVAVKSEYVMSALYKDSKRIDSEGNTEWSDRIEYLKEENENLNEELKMSKELQEIYRKAEAFDHIKVIYDKNMNELSISDTECIEMIGNELEGSDDER